MLTANRLIKHAKIDNGGPLMSTLCMDIDLDLYRHEVRVSTNPLVHAAALRRASLVRLSAIDISPDHPPRTFVFIHGFGGQAEITPDDFMRLTYYPDNNEYEGPMEDIYRLSHK
jgi:hypothetical protein